MTWPMQSPMQQPMQWLMQSPILARWREGRRQLDICIWKPFGCLFHDFWLPFGSFLHLLDALSDLFWTPERLLAHFGPEVQKDAKMDTSWPHFGRPWDPQFETISVKLTTFWRLVFCCFLEHPISSQFACRGPCGGSYSLKWFIYDGIFAPIQLRSSYQFMSGPKTSPITPPSWRRCSGGFWQRNN